MRHEDATARARRVWDRYAPRYDRDTVFWERVLFGNGRAWVCSLAEGEVLEVAIGTGRNLPFYPTGTQLTGVDLSAAMLVVARDRAREVGREVQLRQADAQALPFPDASFDTVVCTLGLCAIPDDRAAIGEMRRVLRPGGRLLLLDHVAGSRRVVRAVQRLLDQVTVRLASEHFTRRPLALLAESGFVIEESERFKAGIVERLVAIKPAGE
jgi:ubiquinone/menaquinone biosynthesis C-methylase UbiE